MSLMLHASEGTEAQVPLACHVEMLARQRWADKKPTVLIGRDAALLACLDRCAQFATSDAPVLITGETGTGKELFARAVFLLSDRRDRSFLSINCAQYAEGQLIASELFGHRRGAFTGAVTDHRGLFQEADGGVIFLDEIGELTLPAQAMLLRVLGEGEIVPVGSTQSVRVDVRVIAATSRDLKPMIDAGTFRADLYYRLRYLRVVVPPVRARGDDWRLLANYYLDLVSAKRGLRKRLSADAQALMSEHDWPGNVREVRSVVDTGYHLSASSLIEPADFAEQLEQVARAGQLARIPLHADSADVAGAALRRMRDGESFWEVVHAPFLVREMSRSDAKAIVGAGLAETRGSYKQLLTLFNIASSDYLRFMDFLRHQRLKPAHR